MIPPRLPTGSTSARSALNKPTRPPADTWLRGYTDAAKKNPSITKEPIGEGFGIRYMPDSDRDGARENLRSPRR